MAMTIQSIARKLTIPNTIIATPDAVLEKAGSLSLRDLAMGVFYRFRLARLAGALPVARQGVIDKLRTER